LDCRTWPSPSPQGIQRIASLLLLAAALVTLAPAKAEDITGDTCEAGQGLSRSSPISNTAVEQLANHSIIILGLTPGVALADPKGLSIQIPGNKTANLASVETIGQGVIIQVNGLLPPSATLRWSSETFTDTSGTVELCENSMGVKAPNSTPAYLMRI
jgi:hypothetical protein